MTKSTRKLKTSFVPKVVFRTAFAGVVPICVAGVACGGASGGGASDGGATRDSGDSSLSPAVACAGFACMGVGYQAFADGSDAPLLSVACIGFDGGACRAPGDGGPHHASKSADAADGDAAAGPCPGGGYACFAVGYMAFADGGDSG